MHYWHRAAQLARFLIGKTSFLEIPLSIFQVETINVDSLRWRLFNLICACPLFDFIFKLLGLISLDLIAVPVIAFVSDDFLIDMLVFILEFEFPFAVFRSKS